jgi:hypothetical protein
MRDLQRIARRRSSRVKRHLEDDFMKERFGVNQSLRKPGAKARFSSEG